MADKRIPDARIRAVWLDDTIPSREAAAMVGLTRSNLWRRAMMLGLPPRKRGRLRVVRDIGRLRRLWLGGVSASDIAGVFGVTPMHVGLIARRNGLPKRRPGTPVISLADFEMREGLARAAAATRVRMAEAEMIDRFKGVWS